MKNILVALMILLVGSCGYENPGDGMESGTDKREWSILQNLEFQNREVRDLKFLIIQKHDYAIAQIPNESGVGAFYIMLNPKAPPFYKQMPSKQYNLEKEKFSIIQSNPKTITTVEMAIGSHVVE